MMYMYVCVYNFMYSGKNAFLYFAQVDFSLHIGANVLKSFMLNEKYHLWCLYLNMSCIEFLVLFGKPEDCQLI